MGGAGGGAAGFELAPELEDRRDQREMGGLAVWSVTSAKPGNGVELLRDNSTDTYWQSDGMQPHLVNVQFQKKVKLQEIAIYVNFKNDESYTPHKLSVRVGNSYHDLREVKVVELEEPDGWVVIPLQSGAAQYIRMFLLQIAVLSNHQNGRDTHIRQIKVFGPTQEAFQVQDVGAHPALEFKDVEFTQFSTVR